MTGGYTYYDGADRYSNHKPNLVCSNSTNDLFTTNTATIGNKVLIYPIGLITVDELMLGGLADEYMNRSSYTFSSYTYWTMTPRHFGVSGNKADEFHVSSLGYTSSTGVTNGNGVRGVINLKSNVEISGGIGTANNPFVVKVE